MEVTSQNHCSTYTQL